MKLSLRTKNILYGSGLFFVACCFASAPAFLKAPENLTTKKTPLNGGQIMRGAYINSGSQDAGADPDWINGVYHSSAASNFQPSAEDVAGARKSLEARKLLLGVKSLTAPSTAEATK